jgi:thiol-disulfide isomerase/thioredoxin
MPDLDGATGWLNTGPLTAEGLRGSVVLVQFWTYTCINWRRTLPQVRAWAEAYRDAGLVVLGVHTPEFSFERDVDNVRRAVAATGIRYPVALDSAYAVWDAFGNSYWPALYLVDAEGRIRHHRFGEGDEVGTGTALRRLLAGTGAELPDPPPEPAEGTGAEAPADWEDLLTAETYLGWARTTGFASPSGLLPDDRRTYALPDVLGGGGWALSGTWTVGREAAALDDGGGRLACRFHARDVHLVMGPAARGRAVPFRVLLDGAPPGVAAGEDVDVEGRGVLTEQRMHQLVRQPLPVAERLVEIEFPEPGVEAFVLTFG